jgi:hypothetical protein
MKEFIFLFRGGKTESVDPGELDDHEDSWDSWMEMLEDEGVLIDGLPMRDRGVLVTKDGMQEADFGTDDGLSGYLIVECEDMDRATELASDCPIFDFGGKVEVRSLNSDRG